MAAELVPGLGGECAHDVGALRQVGGEGDGATALALDVLGDGAGALLVPAVDGDDEAGGGEFAGDGLADAARGACDEGGTGSGLGGGCGGHGSMVRRSVAAACPDPRGPCRILQRCLRGLSRCSTRGWRGGVDERIAQHLDRAAATASALAAVPGRDRQNAVARVGSAHHAETLGLTVSKVHEPTGLFDRRYEPSLSVVLRGRKRSIVGDDDQVWGRERFIITPVDLPVVAGVVDAAGEDGFVAVVWRLDPVVVGEVVASMSVPAAAAVAAAVAPGSSPSGAVSSLPRLGSWTEPLADAFARLIGLLDAPEDVPVLFPLVSREIVLRLLQTEQAPRITAALDGTGPSVVAGATALLTDGWPRGGRWCGSRGSCG